MLRICFFLTCCDRNTSYHSINFWKGIRSARLHQWDFRCSFERSQAGSCCPRGRAASEHHAAQHRAARATSQCRDSPVLPTPAAGGPRRSHQCPGAHGRRLQQQQGEAVLQNLSLQRLGCLDPPPQQLATSISCLCINPPELTLVFPVCFAISDRKFSLGMADCIVGCCGFYSKCFC